MDFDFEILQLTNSFTRDFPTSLYPEIMQKEHRPMCCLLIDVCLDYFICIPFRSHISHKNAFLFFGTKLSDKTKSGLDYTKILILKKTEYFDNNIVIDKDEYLCTLKNINKIATSAKRYIDEYVEHKRGTKKLHDRDYERKYKYSTLKYFHNELGL